MDDRKTLVLAVSGREYDESALEQMAAGFTGKAPINDEQGRIAGWIDQVTMEKGQVLGRLSGIDPAFLERLDSGDIELGLQLDADGMIKTVVLVPKSQAKKGKKHAA